jgi:mRNA degradation ribonuclease J1/J2
LFLYLTSIFIFHLLSITRKNSSTAHCDGHTKKKQQKELYAVEEKGETLTVFALGGLNEIGKNMYIIEYGEDIIVIDCGNKFPDESLLGIDLIIPDFSYLIENGKRVRAVIVTHGHEDHIGGIPYFLKK